MARRPAAKSVDAADVAELLRKGKQIRKKYKALKKRVDASKHGETLAASEIRSLANDLQRAIDDAYRGHGTPPRSVIPARTAKVAQAPAPVRAPIPAPPPPGDVARVQVAMAQAAPATEPAGLLPALGLGRTLLGFLARKLAGVVDQRLTRAATFTDRWSRGSKTGGRTTS
jgi:hypothetical protein